MIVFSHEPSRDMIKAKHVVTGAVMASDARTPDVLRLMHQHSGRKKAKQYHELKTSVAANSYSSP